MQHTPRRILILGAGASFGNGISDQTDTRPPLATSFFDGQLPDALREGYAPLFQLLERKPYLLNSDFIKKMDIETLFGLVEPLYTMGLAEESFTDLEGRFEAFRGATLRRYLNSFVCDLITWRTRWLRETTCPYHDWLVSHYLSPGDTIISFNYDLIVDQSLKRTGVWDETTGYGWPCLSDPHSFTSRQPMDSALTLLKPHGSLNWFPEGGGQPPGIEVDRVADVLAGKRNPGGERLRLEAVHASRVFHEALQHEQARGSDVAMAMAGFTQRRDDELLLPYIVTPSPVKPSERFSTGALHRVWQKVHAALASAEEIVAIGFSFRDPHLNAALVNAAKQWPDSLKIKLIASPDEKTPVNPPDGFPTSWTEREKGRFTSKPETLRSFVTNRAGGDA